MKTCAGVKVSVSVSSMVQNFSLHEAEYYTVAAKGPFKDCGDAKNVAVQRPGGCNDCGEAAVIERVSLRAL